MSHASSGAELVERGYRIVCKLGEGGFGVVFLALDAEDRCVVIKQLLRGAARTPEFRARFQREIDALRRLRHPFVMPILAADATASTPYFVMPHCPGSPLSLALKLQPLSPRRSIGILRDVALALAAVHDAGLIHRDVKPANVLLAPDGTPVLFDFGLAREQQVVNPLTAEGQILGTPAYMAPEVFQGDDIGAPADVYALGVTAVELLLRHNPFLGPDAIECARRHLLLDPPALDELVPHRVSPRLARLVERMLDKVASRRPSARDLAHELRRLQISTGGQGQSDTAVGTGAVVRAWA